MNEIAEVELETNLPLFFDAYADSRTTGALILIDGVTNATVWRWNDRGSGGVSRDRTESSSALASFLWTAGVSGASYEQAAGARRIAASGRQH